MRLLAPFALCVCASASPAQVVLTTIDATESEFFAVDAIGDLDGDGLPDIVAGQPYDPCGFKGAGDEGDARAFSSSSAAELLHLSSANCGDAFGFAVLGLDDIDGDGTADLLVAGNGSYFDPGYVAAYSGASGALLYRQPLAMSYSAALDTMGRRLLDRVGDVDGDGFGDFIVSGTNGAYVRSGRDGSAISFVATSGLAFSFRDVVAGLRDVDVDGVPDVAVADMGAVTGQPTRVLVCTARTGQLIFEAVGDVPKPGESGDGFGSSLSGPGDVNADGHADVGVGLEQDLSASQLGVMRVFSGAGGALILGLHPNKSALDTMTLAHFGDLDEDGFADVLLAVGNFSSGFVELRSGFDAGVLATVDAPPGTQGLLFGINLAGPGDASGDGSPDVIVGGSYQLQLIGGLLSPPSDLQPTLLSLPGGVGEKVGSAIVPLGDVDADGREDLAYGAPGGTGIVRAVSGFNGDTLLSAAGFEDGADFGAALAAVGDMDGDGVTELLVGSPLEDATGADSGAARLLSGASLAPLWSVSGLAAAERFGAAVCGVGDADLDGLPDVCVGAPLADGPAGSKAGAAHLLSGATGASILGWTGDAAGDNFGRAVAGPGDLDGDGLPDVAVGAPKAEGLLGEVDAGRVRVISGANGSVVVTLEAPAGDVGFGAALASASDENGDAVPDLLVGASISTVLGSKPGHVHLISGADSANLLSLKGGSPFGRSVGAADLDADGLFDIVVGEPSTTSPSAGAYSASGNLLLFAAGASDGEAFGAAVAIVDVNGDGHPDVAVGAPLAEESSGRIDVISLVPQWTAVPGGVAGVAGLPKLSGSGTLIPDGAISVALSSAAPLSVGRLLVGVSEAKMPFKGGLLVLVPQFWLTIVTDARGEAVWSAAWPGGVPAGSTFLLQAWLMDPAAVQGVAGSMGLQGHVP